MLTPARPATGSGRGHLSTVAREVTDDEVLDVIRAAGREVRIAHFARALGLTPGDAGKLLNDLVFAPARKREILDSCRPPDVVVTDGAVGAVSVGVCSPPSRLVTALRTRVAGLTALTEAPRTPVQTGSCPTAPHARPLHVVVDHLSRIHHFEANVDTWPTRGLLTRRQSERTGCPWRFGRRTVEILADHPRRRARQRQTSGAGGVDRRAGPSDGRGGGVTIPRQDRPNCHAGLLTRMCILVSNRRDGDTPDC